MARVSCLLNTPAEPEASFIDPMSEPGPSEPKKKKPKRCEWEIKFFFSRNHVDCHSNHPRSTFIRLIFVFFMQQNMMSVCLSVMETRHSRPSSLHHTSV
jgi:hypothetical protein